MRFGTRRLPSRGRCVAYLREFKDCSNAAPLRYFVAHVMFRGRRYQAPESIADD